MAPPSSYILVRPWPGFPAGTVITYDPKGGCYRSDADTDGAILTLAPQRINDDPLGFALSGAEPVTFAKGTEYFFIRGIGSVAAAVAGEFPDYDDARITFGNYFATEDLAHMVADKAAAQLKAAPHGVMDDGA